MEKGITPGPWYAKKSAGDHQGIIASEKTGATVALTYDLKDRHIVAAAPELAATLAALLCHHRIREQMALSDTLTDRVNDARAALALASGL